jgi:hypothetical protein
VNACSPLERRECSVSAYHRTWQLLWHRIDIETDDETVSTALSAIQQEAHHDEPATQRTAFRITRTGTGSLLIEGSGTTVSCASTTEVLEHVFRDVYQRCFDAACHNGWVRVHGALVELDEAVVLLIGPSGAGKTTLALRLGLSGAVVQSDENTLIRGGRAIGIPRRFHAKADAPGRIDALATGAGTTPVAGTEVLAVDPSVLGVSWRVRERPVDHVVCISDVGAATTLAVMDSGMALGELLAQVLPSGETHRTIAREVASLIGAAHCAMLTGAGDLGAVELLRDFVSTATTGSVGTGALNVDLAGGQHTNAGERRTSTQ